jgi:hypothetical protein
MSLLDEIRAESASAGPTCTYRQRVIEKHPDLAEAAEQALTEGIDRSAIIRFLMKRTEVTRSAADRHLRRDCKCQR